MPKPTKPTGPTEAEVREAIMAMLPSDGDGMTSAEIRERLAADGTPATAGAARIALLQLFIGCRVRRPGGRGSARYVRRETDHG